MVAISLTQHVSYEMGTSISLNIFTNVNEVYNVTEIGVDIIHKTTRI